MIPIINFMIQMERDPERAIRQVEIVARHKNTRRQIDKHAWFSTIATTLTMYVSRIFSSGHGRIEQKRA